MKTNFSYFKGSSPDPLNRLHAITFDKSQADQPNTIYDSPNISYGYMTSGDKERIQTVTSGSVATESYAYDGEGRVSDYTMTAAAKASYPLTTSYLYDTANRLTEVRYPASYGLAGSPRRVANISYDKTSRLDTLQFNGQTQSFDDTTNRINEAGYDYDKAGNLIRGKAPNGSWQKYEYDTAGRLRYVRDDTNWIQQSNEYAASRERLSSWSYASADITYYAWGGSSVLAEYSTQYSSSTLTWQKSSVYAGSRLLSTITNTSGNEVTEYHHPDRLGTRLISNPTTATQNEQMTLPFGTLIGAETSATNDKRFTSYDRSEIAGGLDYAVNRNYNSGQSRFTQVDPIGMASASIGNPQSLNLFAYVQNNPIDYIDPSGLNMSGCSAEYSYGQCGGDQGFWGGILSGNPSYGGGGGGGGSFGDHIAYDRQTLGDLPPHLQRQVSQYLEYVSNAQAGNGFVSNEEASRNMARTFAIYYATFDDGSYYTYFEIRVTIGRTDIQNFLDGFRTVGEPALPYLEAIQPIPLPGGSALGKGLKALIIAGKTAKVAKAAGKTKVSGWVARKVFNSLDSLVQNKVKAAIANGIVQPTGRQGIVFVSTTEKAFKAGYTHKIKILGKGGVRWSNKSG